MKSQFWKHRIPLLISALIAILFYLIPADQRYYLVNVKWNYEIDTDFITLDKYSWFLYKQGKVDEAEKISEQALNMAKNSQQPDWVKLIEEHSNRIKTRSWESYRQSAAGRKASP